MFLREDLPLILFTSEKFSPDFPLPARYHLVFYPRLSSMFSLFLAIVCGALTSIVMRLSTSRAVNINGMVAFNYLACLICALALSGTDSLLSATTGFSTAHSLGCLNGLLYVTGMLLMQQNMRDSGVILTTAFAKLGVLIPIFFAAFVFQEIPTPLQIVGVILSIIGIVMIKANPSDRVRFRFSLITLLLVTGGVSTVLKIYTEVGIASLSNVFLLIAFAVAFFIALALAWWKKERLGVTEFMWGMMLGLPNFFTSRFILDALEAIPAVIVYPTRGVATILLVTIVGIALFKEYLNTRQWVAFATILIALSFLNI